MQFNKQCSPIFVHQVNYSNMRKNQFLALTAISLSVLIASCEKQEGVTPAKILGANMVITPPISPSPLPQPGFPLNLNYNGQSLLSNITYGVATGVLTNTIPAAPAKDSLRLYSGAYADALPGNATLGFSIAGSDPVLFSRVRKLEPGKNYTAIALHLTPFFNVALLEDNLFTPPWGKAHVRMVHAIPQELVATLPRKDTVDLTFTGGLAASPLVNSAIFASRRFADNLSATTFNGTLSQFVAVDSGRYSIGLRVAGTPGTSPATGLLGGWQNLRLENQGIYTIIVRIDFPGLLPTFNRPAGLTVIRHK